MTIGFAVIGLGNRGSGFALRTVKDHPDLKLVAVCDASKNHFHLFTEKGIKKFTSYEKLLDFPEVEAVFIATPDDTHAEIVTKAIEKGKHILCEKPLEISLDKVHHIQKRLENYPHVFLVGYVLRYAPLYAKVKALLTSGAIGDIVMGQATDHIHYGGYAFFHDWHRLKKHSGSLLLQKGSHSLDIINWLIDSAPIQVAGFGGLEVFGTKGAIKKFGHPLKEELHCSSCPHKGECEESLGNVKKYKGVSWQDNWPDSCVFSDDIDVDDHQSLVIKYENNAIMTYSLCQFSAFYRREFQFFGTEGELYFDDERQEIVINHRLKPEKTTYKLEKLTGHGGGDEEMLQDFIHCIQTSKTPRSSIDSSVQVSKLIFAAQKAIEENQLVKI